MKFLANSALALALSRSTYGLRFEATGRPKQRSAALGLSRRQASAPNQPLDGLVPVSGTANLEYFVDLYIDGQPIEVLLDTGSRGDLALSGGMLSANNRGIHADIPSSVTPLTISGNVSFADVAFAGYNISQQIFLSLPGNVSSGLTNILGLQPSGNSYLARLYSELVANGTLTSGSTSATGGDPIVARILEEHQSVPNFYSFTLGRELNYSVPLATTRGNFTIGEIIPGYENITKMPQLPSIESPTNTLLGMIVVNETDISMPVSNVSGAPPGGLVVSLDSGYTFAQVSPSIAEAMYGSIPGAAFSNISVEGQVLHIWFLPCDAVVDVSFILGGMDYPIHPLDLNMDPRFLPANAPLGQRGPNNTCIGSFLPWPAVDTQMPSAPVDMILGLPFLRNVYTLVNYGNFTDTPGAKNTTAYVQLASLTDRATAMAEFFSVRGGNGTAPMGGSGSSSEARSTKQCVPAFVAFVALFIMACMA
ncbi:hypothetical protein CALCODRAFT_496700 [Calocera cornea HHB12733]|uniref:Peptidase A1 domain-containing protein n=1 Tax=Calocera cornea HHB12733 TaxID=1353952 RepID=A0A165FPM3_9BASI|nr:hypothetical protein CALCODRAFT_496700 [Calocera cornea HHB12733]